MPSLADWRLHDALFKLQFESNARLVAVYVARFDMMESLDLNLLHFGRDRMLSVAGKAIDAGSREKVSAEIPGQAVELVDVALPISNIARSAPGVRPRGGPPCGRAGDSS